MNEYTQDPPPKEGWCWIDYSGSSVAGKFELQDGVWILIDEGGTQRWDLAVKEGATRLRWSFEVQRAEGQG